MRAKPLAAFYAPRESLLIYHLGWGLMRVFMYCVGTARFELPAEDADRLRACAGSAALLCPNHPTPAEGPLMFLVGHKLGLRYLHFTALEVYGKFGPLGPWMLPGAGCLSIRRRVVDHPAYQAARAALRGRRNVVLFPEGEITRVSDVLLPFERGAAQIAFWGLEELHACGAASRPLYLIPIAIKYLETGNAPRTVDASFARLEHALRLPPAAPERGGLWRLQRIETAYLATLEAALGLGGGLPLSTARWERVWDAKARRASESLGGEAPRPGLTRPQAARGMLNAWDDAWLAHGAAGPPQGSADWRRLKILHKEVAWLNRFMNLDEDYVAAWPSVERFGDVLRRIEEQVLGRHGFPRRIARLRVGEPIDVAPLGADYAANRKATLDAVTDTLARRVGALLEALVRELTAPWDGAYDRSASGLRPVPESLEGGPGPRADRRVV